MVRTQIQLPTKLYARAKQIAESREISLAELVRRGLESILDQYPEPIVPRTAWNFPVATVGKVLVSLDQLRNYAADDEGVRSLVAEDTEE